MRANILDGLESELMDPTERFSGQLQEASISRILRGGGGNTTRPGQRFWDLGPRNFRVAIEAVATEL